MADFLLGLPSEAAITAGQFGRGFRQWAWSGFVQDSWRATPRLTVNLGLRYDYTAPWTEVNGKLSNLLGSEGLLSASASGFPGAWQPDRNNFATRVGIAFDPHGRGRTVIRAGFGVMYETLLQANSVELLENNPPFSSLAVTRTPTPFSSDGSPSRTLTDLAGLAEPSRSIGAVGSFRNPYTMQFHAGVQRQFGQGGAGEISYKGSHGVRLPVYRNANQVPVEALGSAKREEIAAAIAAGRDTTSILQPLRPYPDFDAVTLSENVASSTYHSGQVRVAYRVGPRLLFDTAYTFSKSIDNASDFNSFDPSEAVLNAFDRICLPG